jgi:hypothetical protein
MISKVRSEKHDQMISHDVAARQRNLLAPLTAPEFPSKDQKMTVRAFVLTPVTESRHLIVMVEARARILR